MPAGIATRRMKGRSPLVEATGATCLAADRDSRAFLERVRGYDFLGYSDAELKDALNGLEGAASVSGAAALVFAVVAEVIDRRLGVWRVFDDPADGARGADMVAALLGSDAAGRVVHRVREERKFRRVSDIHLPAAFYRAARGGVVDGFRFRVTDEQLLAGFHLFQGRVVQMNAGEGKTAAAAFPAVLHALSGRQVHVITANDYLADRDVSLLAPVYESLGLSVGSLLSHMEDDERRLVYRKQVVYGTMREFGFDYLRDNLKLTATEKVQRPLDAVIIDEVDHALIDEAFTPMIISGQPVGADLPIDRVRAVVAELIEGQRGIADDLAERASQHGIEDEERLALLARLMLGQPEHPALPSLLPAGTRMVRRVRALAMQELPGLTDGLLYSVDVERCYVTLTEAGWGFVEGRLGSFEHLDTLDGRASRRMTRQYALGNCVYQMLRAFLLLKRDVDYVVDDDSIVLIDQHTGRPKDGSIYQFNLQSALEVKEGVTPRPECETLGQISVAGFMGLYEHASGMTGTAAVSTDEFERKYGMEVVVVPPGNPMMRVDLGPKVFLTKEDKLGALVDEVVSRHRSGQPVLVGTGSVEQSEDVSRRLAKRGMPYNLLNAVTTHAEAQTVRDAGRFGAVTVATNMAGRGTDILLEPGLNARIARRCVELAQAMLNEDCSEVIVSCNSREQSDVLREQLDRTEGVQADWTGVEVTVSFEDSPSGIHSGWMHSSAEAGRLRFSMGLCVIGAEMHESTRVHLQLNGRSGRQGEFGETQSFLSLEDRVIHARAWEILGLPGCRGVDTAGREYFSGDALTSLVDRLRRESEREGEAQRGLMQDYFAVLDLHTLRYYRRRREVMGQLPMDGLVRDFVTQAASGLVSWYFDGATHDEYRELFGRMSEGVWRDYGADCSSLYGGGLDTLADELGGLIGDRLDALADRAGAMVFSDTARLLYIQTFDEAWRGHLARLRDMLSAHVLGAHNHKSAVAAYVRACDLAWEEFRCGAEVGFLSRLASFPFLDAVCDGQQTRPVSEQVEALMSVGGPPVSWE